MNERIRAFGRIALAAAALGLGAGCDRAASTGPATAPAATAPATGPALLKPRGDIAGLPNFAQVSPVLYRGAQPTAEGFAQLKRMGVKTIVNLRWLHSDRDELKGLGLQYVEIPAQAWDPEDKDMARFLRVVRDPAHQPVFVHCQHGADRTGCAVAVYRMVEQGWRPEQAVQELPNFGFHTVWGQILKYLKQFDGPGFGRTVEQTPMPKVQVVR